MSIGQEFQKAVDIIQNLPKDGPYTPSNDEKLQLYGLFKQATEGKCNTSRPGMLDLVGKAKWDAWNKLGDMSKDEAMRKYVDVYKGIEKKAADKGQLL